MRVLVGLDGSGPGDVARELVRAVSWAEGTMLRFITVVPDLFTMFGPWAETVPLNAPDIEEATLEQQETMLQQAAASMPRDAQVQTVLRRGRPATVIAEEASSFGADLVVLGARGHSAWSEALLGSVSAEVVDHAPCPVLVARTPGLERVILSADGSDGATRARRFLIQWGMLGRAAVRVIGVASAPAPWHSGVSPLMVEAALDAYADTLREVRERLTTVATESVAELAPVASEATFEIRTGDPAREIVTAAAEWGASLIVTGSRGLTGLRRIVLGSVARNVLHHAPCSVLIVRAIHRDDGEDGSAA